jgi:hypothetical protein
MGRNEARHLAAWLLTVAFELGAGILSQQQEWTVVTILFWTGIACLVVGYFPDLKARFRSGNMLGWELLKQAIVAVVMASAVYWITFFATIQIQQMMITPAHLFEPDSDALKDKTFVRETPEQIMSYFTTYTNITANRMLGEFIGKSYAISGNVGDVQDLHSVLGAGPLFMKNQISVYLEQKSLSPLVVLTFADRWMPEIELAKKHDKISAYCKIDKITSFSLNLNDCQLVRR